MQEELIKRREFLLQTILAAGGVASIPFTALSSDAGLANTPEKQGKQKTHEPIKAFCIDFNWEPNVGCANPGTFTHADPEAHMRWYKDLGANTIQSFCVSLNGYAWYSNSAVAPVNPGLEKKNFLAQMCQCGHDAGMKVMGYFTFGNNPVWEAKNPDLRKDKGVDYIRIPATLEWLDYFCRQLERRPEEDEHRRIPGGIDPSRTAHGMDRSREAYVARACMGEKFSSTAAPSPQATLEFDKLAMSRAWQHIRSAANSTRKSTIWTNHPFVAQEKPMWEGHRLLKEVDWVLNESPDIGWLYWLQKQVGQQTLVVQNLCGWPEHDANAWKRINTRKFGLYEHRRT